MKASLLICWTIGALLVAVGFVLLGDWKHMLGGSMVWWGCYWFSVDGGKEENRDKNWVE